MTLKFVERPTLKRSVSIRTLSVALAKDNVRIETDRFNVGRSTNFDVMLRLEDERQAELRKVQAQIDWHKAETMMLMLTGDLLPAYGVSVPYISPSANLARALAPHL